MNNSTGNTKKENIELSLPINAAYVSAARLTASSIANRLSFDIDEIEDVKSAVSEACTYIIKKAPVIEGKLFKIIFIIDDGSLSINISFDMTIETESVDNEIGILMIKALMDDMEISCNIAEGFRIAMKKIHKINDLAL